MKKDFEQEHSCGCNCGCWHEHHHEEKASCGCGCGCGHEHGEHSKWEAVTLVLGGVIFVVTEWVGVVPEAYHIYALIIAYLLLGGKIVLTALKNLAKGHVFDENFLMTVATLGAFAIQAWEEAVGVMFFYRVGEYFEHRAVEKSRGQIMAAVDMRP